ncbi:MAG: extracellular solute-binding protein [Lachnospiraceae bacterium]|nr:extracellular solute-binding protein [Lachnospiraceae bacterium]MDY2945064.1 extracellular solute-binding protein [Lachnospiraceae bacterium]MDY6279284.1 extracellular solute-binding protein [Roseburia faecis]MDY6309494.1 extracellular solute-binding protein [Oribacterium sp.]
MKKEVVNRMFAVMLSSAVMAGLLAGCGSSSTGTDTGASDASQNQTTTASEEDTSSASGNTASDASASDKEPITITWMRSQSAVQPMSEENKVVDMIRDALNVNIELQLIPDADYTTKKSVALASDDLPDVIQGLSVDELRQYAPTGMFLNIYDYKDQAKDYLNIVEADDRAKATKGFEVEGGLYGFQTLEYNRIDIASLPAIRMDLLKETGMDTPTTWDDFYKVLLKIKENHPDNYVFSTRNGTTYMLGQYAFGMGSGGFPTFSASGMYYEPDQDKWLYGPTQDSFVPVITFFANAYKDGLLDPDYASMDKDTEQEKLSNGTLSMVYDNNSFVGRVYNPALAQVDKNAYFDILEPMDSQNGTKRALRYERDWTEFTCVNVDTKYPERVIEAINWMYTEEGRMATNFGEEGVDYTIDSDGNVVTSQDLIDKHANDADVASGIQGELGAGLLGLGHYIDESLNAQISDPAMVNEGKTIRDWTQKGEIYYNQPAPTFTSEEQEQVTELEQSISNVFSQEIDSFINGQKSLDQWPDFVKSLKDQGTEKLEEIYNTAYKRTQE